MEVFREIFFCCKIYKKTPVLESQFNKVTGLYPPTSLKERTPTQVFSSELCEILKTPYLQNTSRQLLLFYLKKRIINKILKKPLRKGKKNGNSLQEEQPERQNNLLFTSSLHILLLFENFFISLFFACYDIFQT